MRNRQGPVQPTLLTVTSTAVLLQRTATSIKQARSWEQGAKGVSRCGKWANEQLQKKAKHGALENACNNGFDQRWSYYAAETAAPAILPLFSTTSTTRPEAEDVQRLDSKHRKREREREFTHSHRQEGASLRYAYCRARSFPFLLFSLLFLFLTQQRRADE